MIEYRQGMLKQAPIRYNISTTKSHHKDKNGKYNITKKCEDIFCFDIETTSAWIDENGNIIGYSKGKDNDYWNSLTPLSLCYIWQFGFNDTVYYGRELRDFLLLLNELPTKSEIIIWVHNLAWEFQFLVSIFEWTSVFARNSHKPIKAITKSYPNIVFRCTYMLTRLSLDSWGKQIGFEKKTGQLDYEKVRTPLTYLDEKEMEYSEVDILVMYKGLLKYKERYGSIFEIPLTQTGTIRREVKSLLTQDANYVKRLKRLVPRDADEYKRLQDVFAGGYTHANRLYAGEVIDLVNQNGLIRHFDFASSYPTVMICEKYPMSPWVYTGKTLPDDSTFDEYAYIIHLKLHNVISTNFNTYIAYSKCYRAKNSVLDNGRIISADEVEIIITEQDWITIQNNYNFNEVEVIGTWRSYKDYLPLELVKYILYLYGNKTTLKDNPEYEDLYLQSKQYINSCFGMMVTAIIQADIFYKPDGTWAVGKVNSEMAEDKFEKLRNFNPREKRYFLSYSWGCWVTAYARRNLWKCIERTGVKGRDVLYVDTDSIFAINNPNYDWYNEEITNKIRKACNDMNIDFALTRPKTPKGKEKPLGIFAEETPCTQFITLGAKRYCERRIYIPNNEEADGNLHLTISGINKGSVDLLGDNIYNFVSGFDFIRDSDYVTKRLSTYINNQPMVEYPDGYISTYKTGINLRRNGYKLSITDEYADLIDYRLQDFNADIFEQRTRAYIY